ncbi:hypothetical protein JX265_002961 [Neoarthrinium moseri]|uniref:F-box domain-containing protein n=1 Tax=Neoarthrinium moseri TaxID=1658444 RepID=A0A9P9WTC3_9PEZI|nr:hypothetical protein JX265_002961 [Neoarthrinium moseri]
MSDGLSQVLDSLRLPDGKPDLQARHANLVSLIHGGHLDVNEIRLLKDLLGKVALQKDIISNLPVELVILTIQYLTEKDILACLGVSRSWKATFTGGQVIFNLADRFFPRLIWEGPSTDIRNPECAALLRSCFLASLQKRVNLARRSAEGAPPMIEKQYLWDTETEFILQSQQYADYPNPNLPSNCRAIYSYGRVAWQRETHTLVIDCLQTKTRKILTFPGGKLLGPEMELAALGDKLAVAIMGRNLLAWDIETASFQRATLPSLATSCTTSGDRVAVLTGTEVFVWSFGGRLLAAKLPTLDTEPLESKRYSKVFVHPFLEDVIYVRQVFKRTQYLLFVIHKLSNGKHDRTFKFNIKTRYLANQKLSSALLGFIPLTSRWMPDMAEHPDGYCLLEFDCYHEKLAVRDISHCGKRMSHSYSFTVDDDFAVELNDKSYCVF